MIYDRHCHGCGLFPMYRILDRVGTFFPCHFRTAVYFVLCVRHGGLYSKVIGCAGLEDRLPCGLDRSVDEEGDLN